MRKDQKKLKGNIAQASLRLGCSVALLPALNHKRLSNSNLQQFCREFYGWHRRNPERGDSRPWPSGIWHSTPYAEIIFIGRIGCSGFQEQAGHSYPCLGLRTIVDLIPRRLYIGAKERFPIMTPILLVLTLVLGSITIGSNPAGPAGGVPPPSPPVSLDAHVGR